LLLVILDIDPSNIEALGVLVNLSLICGDLDGAEWWSEKVIAIYPELNYDLAGVLAAKKASGLGLGFECEIGMFFSITKLSADRTEAVTEIAKLPNEGLIAESEYRVVAKIIIDLALASQQPWL